MNLYNTGALSSKATYPEIPGAGANLKGGTGWRKPPSNETGNGVSSFVVILFSSTPLFLKVPPAKYRQFLCSVTQSITWLGRPAESLLLLRIRAWYGRLLCSPLLRSIPRPAKLRLRLCSGRRRRGHGPAVFSVFWSLPNNCHLLNSVYIGPKIASFSPLVFALLCLLRACALCWAL